MRLYNHVDILGHVRRFSSKQILLKGQVEFDGGLTTTYTTEFFYIIDWIRIMVSTLIQNEYEIVKNAIY